MQQLIYASQPIGYSQEVLAAILADARVKNRKDNITGALICRPDIYVQLLEGPTEKVEAMWRTLNADPRHTDLCLLVKCKVVDRLFPNWFMRCDPARSWLWSREDVRQGVHKSATVREARAVFVRLANDDESENL